MVFIPQAQPHAQSLFLFPIVFGINAIRFGSGPDRLKLSDGRGSAAFFDSIFDLEPGHRPKPGIEPKFFDRSFLTYQLTMALHVETS